MINRCRNVKRSIQNFAGNVINVRKLNDAMLKGGQSSLLNVQYVGYKVNLHLMHLPFTSISTKKLNISNQLKFPFFHLLTQLIQVALKCPRARLNGSMNMHGNAKRVNTVLNVDAQIIRTNSYFVINAIVAITYIALACEKYQMVSTNTNNCIFVRAVDFNLTSIHLLFVGRWHCAVCTVCTMCGARRPEGHNNPNLTPQQKQKLLAVAKWTHEYQTDHVTKLREHTAMLCTSCVALKHSASRGTYFN